MNKKEVFWLRQVLAYVFVLLVLSVLFYASFRSLNYNWNWEQIYGYRQKFVQGWFTTLGLSVASLLLSSLLGFVVALCVLSQSHFLKALGHAYVELIRGTPFLVQILIFFYVIANAMGLEDRYVVGVLSLSFFSSAYMSEIFRAGIQSVGRTQLDAARAMGLRRGQTFRYVILPQALQVVLGPLAGQFVSLVKDSSLLSIIAISELTLNAQEVNSFTYSTLESYLPLAVGYLIITLPISLSTRRLERSFRFET